MPERHPFSEVVSEVAEELKAARQDGAKAKGVPFGKVRADVNDLERTVETSQEARQALRNRPDGPERILRLIRAKRGKRNA